MIPTWLIVLIAVQGVVVILGGAWLVHNLFESRAKARRLEMAFAQVAAITSYGFSISANPELFAEHLERYGWCDPKKPVTPEFTVPDPDLDLLLNLSVDMVQGRANHDVAMWWMDTLDKVLDRLNPQTAPHEDGQPAVKA